ncbi:putative transcriptional regulatory protein YxjL [Pullulanibacillus camelliae]|uniref:Putative transcriptional regulatory protein YxjL n=1 Tax=Pullulanibacillus camelliae TaxID=1707096 RepID=A0A8J3DT57_9BACL|nr:response regulator transcription factor [Pullulanibacillus camelliae]GGE43604.1 putative transcriptional regulatory protein YxjL [Pullulanibacillus camelliae]
MENKIHIGLVDDQAIIRQGLRYIINSQPDMEIVMEAGDGEEAVEHSIEAKPDLILMDIRLPKQTGIEATREILKQCPDIRIILLTTFDVQEYVFEGIRAGAIGYLLKDAETDELLEGIRSAITGAAIYKSTTASQALAQFITAQQIAPDASVLPAQDEVEALTEREIDVLQLMAYGRRNSEIAEQLYISRGTVKTHVHRILQKLGVEDRTQAVVMAIRQGYVK